MANAQKEATLKSAIGTRQHIGEATGILTARHHVTTTQAFQMLVRASQNSNVPLRDLARRLVETENQAVEEAPNS